MAIRAAINGFGRIGRLFFRQAEKADIEVVAINDLGDIKNLAYLLQHDSVYGWYAETVSADADNNVLRVGDRQIKVYQEKDPAKLLWGEAEVDVVVESTGVFDSFQAASAHLAAGAKHVVITAPARDAEGTAGGRTILMGVSSDDPSSVLITSNGSCTTNATAPIISVLSEKIGIKKAILSTVHAYTATQAIVDSPVRGLDFRRGRAAASNICPSTTGAAETVGRVIPDVEGRFDGLAYRVPVAAGSLADITLVMNRLTDAEEINTLLKSAASEPRWQGILAVSEEQLVSSDIIGQPYGAIVDLSFTRVVDGDLAKVISWYDNEWGYTSTLIRHVLRAVKDI